MKKVKVQAGLVGWTRAEGSSNNSAALPQEEFPQKSKLLSRSNFFGYADYNNVYVVGKQKFRLSGYEG